MKKLLTHLSILFLLAIAGASCNEDSGFSLPNEINSEEELVIALKGIRKNSEAPGFAVSIAKNNSIVFQGAFGYADIQEQKPYTNQTVQHIASTSKTFIGAATIKAIEQGYFTLETAINTILPFDVINPNYPEDSILVKHLVTHTSGILDIPETYLSENYYILPGENLQTDGAILLTNGLQIKQRNKRSLLEFLEMYLIEGKELYSDSHFADATAGTSWSYSNIGAGLMALCIEAATGINFADYVKSNILQPLGMNSSTYDIAEVDRENMAKWYLNKNTPFPFYGNDSYAEGSLFTTNIDMGKYLLNMMEGEREENDLLFPTSAYDILFADQLPQDLVDPGFAENMGIFWIKSENLIQHHGSSFGVSSYIEIDALNNSGYTLITNMDSTFDYTVLNKISILIDQAINKYLHAN